MKLYQKESRPWKLQTLVMCLVFMVVLISALATALFISIYVTKNEEKHLSEKIQAIARVTANSTVVIQSLQEKSEVDIQKYANEIRALSDVGFVVVMDMDLIRKSHPLSEEVGQSFFNREDAKKSLEGEEYFSIEEGPLGMGMRVFTPVYDERNEQIGVVVVGVSLDMVESLARDSRKYVYIGAILQLCLGAIGAYYLSCYMKRKLYGLEPVEIAKLLQERNAMIESAKEGIIGVNEDGKIAVISGEALKLMGFERKEELLGQPIDDHMPSLAKAMRNGRSEENVEQIFNHRTVLANNVPIMHKGKVIGGLSVFKDKTDLQDMADQLTGIKLYTESLRAQSHEFMNKFHVILGLVHLKKYKEMSRYIENLVEDYETEKGFIVKRIKNPLFAGFLLGKLSKARELGIQLVINEDSYMPSDIKEELIHDLIRIAGNLIENAFDALDGVKGKRVFFSIGVIDGEMVLEVRDNGKGIPEEIAEVIFQKGYSTKGMDRGYGLFLTKQSIEKLNGTIELKTKPGAGTLFTVILPLWHAEGVMDK